MGSVRRLTGVYAGVYRASWVAVALAVGACSSSSEVRLLAEKGEAGSKNEETGRLRLELVTQGSSQHRLNNARFSVTRAGVEIEELDSGANPDVGELQLEVEQGTYQVELQAGWSLDQLDEAGQSVGEVRAVLVSTNPATVTVRNGGISTVGFSFTTVGGRITFGVGGIRVRIAYVDSVALSSCDLARPFSCPSGQSCLLADESGTTFCVSAGSLEVGESCDAEQCVAGAQCLALDPEEPDNATCTAYCDPGTPSFGCDCRGLSLNSGVGVCGAPPEGTCDLLAQTGCEDGVACQYDGGSFGFCGDPGELFEGSSCFGASDCQAGLDCFGYEPEFGQPGICLGFCDLSAPDCEFCNDVGTGNVGRCYSF